MSGLNLERATRKMLLRRAKWEQDRKEALACEVVGPMLKDSSLVPNFKVLPLQPLAAHFMIHPTFRKDRENRRSWPSTWNKEGGRAKWMVLVTTSIANNKAQFQYWSDFIAPFKLPWDIREHTFPKACVLGLVAVLPPLPPDEEDLSQWVDTKWGDYAWRIQKCLKFDTPITGVDVPQSFTSPLSSLAGSAMITKHIINRLRSKTYSWIWRDLGDDNLSLVTN